MYVTLRYGKISGCVMYVMLNHASIRFTTAQFSSISGFSLKWKLFGNFFFDCHAFFLFLRLFTH